jgi:hypothetical protein
MFHITKSSRQCTAAQCIWGFFFLIGIILTVISSIGIYSATHTWIATNCTTGRLAKCGLLQGHEGDVTGLWFEMYVKYQECDTDTLVRIDVFSGLVAAHWEYNCNKYYDFHWANNTTPHKVWYSEYDDCIARWNSPYYVKNRGDQDDPIALAGWITVCVIGCLFVLSPIWAVIVEIKWGSRLSKYGLNYEPL